MAFTDLQVEVNLIKNPRGKTRAFANLIIDNTIRVSGFTVVEHDGKTFVGPPQTKGTRKDDAGNMVDHWYDDVQWIDAKAGDNEKQTPTQREAYSLILSEYENVLSGGKRGAAAEAQTATSARAPAPAKRPSAAGVGGGGKTYSQW